MPDLSIVQSEPIPLHIVSSEAGGASSVAPKTDDEIIRSYGYDPAVIKKAHLYSPDTFRSFLEHPPEETMTPMDGPGLMSDAAHGFTKAAVGLMQLGSHGVSALTGNPADAQFADLLHKVSEEGYRRYRGGDPNALAELGGQALVPVPGGAAKTLAGAVAKGAVTGGTAALMQPVNVAGPDGSYAGPKTGQVVTGAGAGAVVGGLLHGLFGGTAKAVNARTTLLPEEIAAPLQARSDELAAQAKKTADEFEAARLAAKEQNAAADEAAKARGAATTGANTSGFTDAAQRYQKRVAGQFDATQFGGIDEVVKAAKGDAAAGSEFAKAPPVVDGLRVRGGPVPNMDSIGASIDNPEVLPGVREVPMSAFHPSYSEPAPPTSDIRINKLADAIKQSGEITPLIVVNDAEGAYVLEGGHRLDALHQLGKKSFPAVVVNDLDSLATSGAGTPPDPKAGDLLKMLQAAKTPDQVQRASVQLQDFRTSRTASELYDKVGDLVEKHQLPDVELTHTDEVLRGLSDFLEKDLNPAANKNVARVIDGIRESTAGTDDALADLSYQNVRRLDSSLGQMIRDGHTGDGALIGNNGVQYLQQVRNAVRQDMSAFAENSGAQDVQEAARKADQYFQQTRAPFKQLDVAKAGTAVDADKIYDGFINAGSGDKAQRYYNALDDKGRAAVRSQMVTDAVNQATDNLHGTVDPAKVFDYLTKMQRSYGVFFKGADKFEMDGLLNLSKQIALNNEAAAAAAKNAPKIPAPSGAPVAQAQAAAEEAKTAADAANKAAADSRARMSKAPLGAAAAIGTMASVGLSKLGVPVAGDIALGVGGAAELMRALTSTDAGRRFLLASSRLRPGTPALQNILDTALNTVMQQTPAAAARTATQ